MIDKYLISTCLFTIDKFNFMYKNLSKDDLKRIADNEYTESDLVFKLGSHFGDFMASFNVQGKSKERGNDIVVREKDFMIEVKLLRNWKSTNTTSNSMTWEQLNKDFQWIIGEIKKDNRGRRAFIIGWFNAVDRFSRIVQLGESGGGGFPNIDKNKMDFFPFINTYGNKTSDVFYMYYDALKVLKVKIPAYEGESMNCMFFGKETDKFHMAIYW